MNRVWSIMFLGFGVSCANLPKVNLKHREYLFPNGTYYQGVTLKLKTPQHQTKKHEFDAILKISDKEVRIALLGHLFTRIASIREDRETGIVDVEVFSENFLPLKNALHEVYRNLREIFRWKLDGVSSDQTVELMPRSTIQFSQFDENRIPKKIELQSPKFEIKIDVTNYEV